MKTTKCPCGSDKELEVCCAPYIKGLKSAETPEQCMRSRYTAFVLGEYDYIRKTWHPDTLPELSDDEPNTWVGLEIRNTSVDGDEGEVEFVAKLIFDNKLETLHEISDFEKVENQWVYVSGEFMNENAKPRKISKNEDCPCGSGIKFKRCHFK